MSNKQSSLTKLTPKSFKDVRSFSRSQFVAFVVVFAVIGGFLLYRSFAAGAVVATVQAEKMTLPAGASVIQDSVANAGQAVKITKNGVLKSSVVLAQSATSMSLVARGVNCYNGPWLNISVDGKTLLPNTKIASKGWKSYSTNGSVAAGTHSVSVSVTSNGYASQWCNRVVYLDLMTFYGPTAPPTSAPTIALSASPSVVQAGNSSMLTWSTTNASSCTAGGSWSGARATSGVVSTGALNATANYSLICTGAGGSANASATVTVTPSTSPPPTPPPTTPPPTTPPPTPPPTTPPPTPPGGSGTVSPGYVCNGPVNGLRIVGTGHGSGSAPAVINLASGCTGSLSFDITVDGSGDDCVKVQGGAHDLNITSGSCVCTTNTTGNHQDGIQVQGGSNVVFHNVTINCPNSAGAGAFYIDGKDFGGINGVICDGCNLRHFVIPYIFTGPATNSGVRNSVLHMSPYQNNRCFTNPAGGGTGMINENNTCVP